MQKHDAVTYPVGQKFRAQKAALNEEDRQKLKEYSYTKYEAVYPEEDRKGVTSNLTGNKESGSGPGDSAFRTWFAHCLNR